MSSKVLGILCKRCKFMSADCAHYPCDSYVEIERLLSAQSDVPDMNVGDMISRQAGGICPRYNADGSLYVEGDADETD